MSKTSKSGNPSKASIPQDGEKVRNLVEVKSKNMLLPIIGIVVAMGLLIAIIWGVVFTSGDSDTDEPKKADPTSSETADAEPEAKDLLPPGKKGQRAPGGTNAQQKEVLLSLTGDFLEEAATISTKMDEKDYQGLLQSGDASDLTQKYKDYVVVNSILESENLTGLTYASFLYVAGQMSDTLAENGGKIKPIVQDPTKNVFLDMETGVAFVPLSIYRGEDTALSINWVYVDGEWRIYPYSFLDGLQTAEIVGSKAPTDSLSNQ